VIKFLHRRPADLCYSGDKVVEMILGVNRDNIVTEVENVKSTLLMMMAPDRMIQDSVSQP